MSLPVNGEPVRLAVYASPSPFNSSMPIGIYYPGTSTIRPLAPQEFLTIVSITVSDNGGAPQLYILNTAAPTSTFTQDSILLGFELNDPGQSAASWHDDGTYAVTGLPGVVPSLFETGGNGNLIVLAGSGVVNGHGMLTTRPTFLANLTPGSTGNF